MATNQWRPKPKANLSWQLLSGRDLDTGERWTIVWDTERKPGLKGRNRAVEKLESGALDRARHMLRMGFVVYEIWAPTGAVFLEEAEIKERLGLQPTET